MCYNVRNGYSYLMRNLLPQNHLNYLLSDFSDIRFKAGEDVSEYYQKKMNVGRTLGLENKLLFEGLTDSLLRELKQLVIINSPKSTTEWRELVHKLNKLKIIDNTPQKNASILYYKL